MSKTKEKNKPGRKGAKPRKGPKMVPIDRLAEEFKKGWDAGVEDTEQRYQHLLVGLLQEKRYGEIHRRVKAFIAPLVTADNE